MKAWICVRGELLDAMLAEAGMKQSDQLAPAIFAIFLAMVFSRTFKDSEVGVNIRY